MIVAEALVTELEAYAGLTALIDERIYPTELPQDPTLPAVTYNRVTTNTEHIQGETHSSFMMPIYRIQCWAKAYLDAENVSEQVKDALDGFNGILGGVGGVPSVITLVNDGTLGDDLTDWERVILDFEIWNTQ